MLALNCVGLGTVVGGEAVGWVALRALVQLRVRVAQLDRDVTQFLAEQAYRLFKS